jgi:hypothetical protein
MNPQNCFNITQRDFKTESHTQANNGSEKWALS